MLPETDICVVVVNFFNEEEVAGFVVSQLLNQEGVNVSVIVVDNGSHNPSTLAAIAGRRVLILSPGKNLGYIHAFLYAHSFMIQNSLPVPRFIMLSNSDIEFSDNNVFKNLVTYYNTTDFACVGPSVFSTLQKIEQNPFAAERLSYRRLRIINIFQSSYLLYLIYQGLSLVKNRFKSTKPIPQIEGRSVEVYAIHGSIMAFSSAFLSTSAFKLSDAPFLFGEELYVAEVARAVGAKSYFDSRLRVFHKEHATT